MVIHRPISLRLQDWWLGLVPGVDNAALLSLSVECPTGKWLTVELGLVDVLHCSKAISDSVHTITQIRPKLVVEAP